MLDFEVIKTPPRHGDTLVAPAAADLAAVARANADQLADLSLPILDTTLGKLRSRTRTDLIGRDNVRVIVTGHAPDFIHPGVWAKHIVAARLAASLDGHALDLVVDSDAPKETALRIPVVKRDRVSLGVVRYADQSAGMSFDQIGGMNDEETARFGDAVRGAMGARFEQSQMPRFIEGLRARAGAGDWVDQAVHARRHVEAQFGIVLQDVRVSRLSFAPVFADWMLNAERFATCYNRALAEYRLRYRVRSINRPIPDLVCEAGRCELPIWVCRHAQPRQRLFVEPSGDGIRLWAGATSVGTVGTDGWPTSSEVGDGWRLRPRALALTMWARLFLADLFLHGIGGAKYDRITDRIIEEYYGVSPPHIACVSATLLANLPRTGVTADDVRRARWALRDTQHNPQRHLAADAETMPWFQRRQQAVRAAMRLKKTRSRDRAGRRHHFQRIRDINAALLRIRPDRLPATRRVLTDALHKSHSNEAASSREYFFGLYDRDTLNVLLNALPAEADFGV